VNKNIPFPKTHILEILKQKCVEIDDSFQDIDFENLSQYAVEIRYPDEFYLPDVEEAIESVKIAEQVKSIILDKLGLKEEDIIKLFDEMIYEILQQYAKKDKRIKLFRQPKNIGGLKNFKFVLEQAQTPYFIWLAGHDIWHP
jgi:hypothetical protein